MSPSVGCCKLPAAERTEGQAESSYWVSLCTCELAPVQVEKFRATGTMAKGPQGSKRSPGGSSSMEGSGLARESMQEGKRRTSRGGAI